MRAIVMLPLIITPMVWPSVALATAWAAMLPPAPTGWPRARASGSARVRATRSGDEPHGKPTMIFRGLLGQPAVGAWAKALSQRAARARTRVARRSGRVGMEFPRSGPCRRRKGGTAKEKARILGVARF